MIGAGIAPPPGARIGNGKKHSFLVFSIFPFLFLSFCLKQKKVHGEKSYVDLYSTSLFLFHLYCDYVVLLCNMVLRSRAQPYFSIQSNSLPLPPVQPVTGSRPLGLTRGFHLALAFSTSSFLCPPLSMSPLFMPPFRVPHLLAPLFLLRPPLVCLFIFKPRWFTTSRVLEFCLLCCMSLNDTLRSSFGFHLQK